MKLHLYLIGLVTVLLCSCTATSNISGHATAVDAVKAYIDEHTDNGAADFVYLSERTIDNKILVLHSMPSQNQTVPLFYSIATRDSSGWQIIASHGISQPNEKDVISFDVHLSSTTLSQFLVVYGRVLNDDVGFVEVTFEDEQVVRDEPTQGVFAVTSLSARNVCLVEVFDKQNQLLQKFPRSECGR